MSERQRMRSFAERAFEDFQRVESPSTDAPAPNERRNAGRFIPGERIGQVRPWTFGAIDQGGDGEDSAAPAPEAQAATPPDLQARLEAEREQAWQAGREEGLAEGRRQADAAIRQHMAQAARDNHERASKLLESLAAEVQAQRAAIGDTLVALACDIARQVLRAQLTTDPQQVRALVDEALDLVSGEQGTRVVRLHPQDLALLQPGEDAGSGARIQWRADDTIEPGGCIVEAGPSTIDATLGKRWQQVIGHLGVDAPLQSHERPVPAFQAADNDPQVRAQEDDSVHG